MFFLQRWYQRCCHVYTPSRKTKFFGWIVELFSCANIFKGIFDFILSFNTIVGNVPFFFQSLYYKICVTTNGIKPRMYLVFQPTGFDVIPRCYFCKLQVSLWQIFRIPWSREQIRSFLLIFKCCWFFSYRCFSNNKTKDIFRTFRYLALLPIFVGIHSGMIFQYKQYLVRYMRLSEVFFKRHGKFFRINEKNPNHWPFSNNTLNFVIGVYIKVTHNLYWMCKLFLCV